MTFTTNLHILQSLTSQKTHAQKNKQRQSTEETLEGPKGLLLSQRSSNQVINKDSFVNVFERNRNIVGFPPWMRRRRYQYQTSCFYVIVPWADPRHCRMIFIIM